MRLTESFETVDFKVIFDEHFDIISLFDKRYQREIVPKGERLNQLVAYEDLPMDYDAWDIDIYYQKKPYPLKQVLSTEVVEQGEIRDTLKIKRQFEDSLLPNGYIFIMAPEESILKQRLIGNSINCC